MLSRSVRSRGTGRVEVLPRGLEALRGFARPASTCHVRSLTDNWRRVEARLVLGGGDPAGGSPKPSSADGRARLGEHERRGFHMDPHADVVDAAPSSEELLAYVRDPAHLSPEELERRRHRREVIDAQTAASTALGLDADEHNERLLEANREAELGVVERFFPPDRHYIRYRVVRMIAARLPRPICGPFTRARAPRPVRRTRRLAARGDPSREPDPPLDALPVGGAA